MTTAVRIESAAAIVAASICWLTRWSEKGHTSTHPARCGWCDFPPAELLASIEGFDRFDHGAWLAKEFRGLPPSIRERLVREAQELEPAAAQPMPKVEPTPADEDRGEGVRRESGAPDKDRMAAVREEIRVHAFPAEADDEESVPWM
jgi:hypothetical protein